MKQRHRQQLNMPRKEPAPDSNTNTVDCSSCSVVHSTLEQDTNFNEAASCSSNIYNRGRLETKREIPFNMCCSYDSDHEDTEGSERPFRMKRRVPRQRVCGVCGDLALCHNFGALTCETCKAFFRRNANKLKASLPCPQGGSCIITKATRRHCAACRLKKCYAIGMDRSLILSDDELKGRQRKLKEAAERRQSKLPEQDAATSSTIFTTTPFLDLKAKDSPETSECSTIHRNEIKGGVNRNEAAAGSQIPSGSSPSWQVALRLTFRHIRREQKPTGSHLYYSLTGHETSLLEYLNRSYKEIFWSVTHPKGDGSFSVKDLPLERVMVAVDSMLRKFINFSKRVPEFRQLMEEDKATLLKSRSMNVYCVRLAEAYLPEKLAWKTTVGEEVAHLFKDPSVLNQIVSFSKGTKHVMEDDITIYGLMFALVLFNPLDLSLQNRDFISKQKDKYMVLLKHYLESQFSFLHADRYLAEIINILVDVEALGQKLEEFFSQYSSHFYPLITEFLSK